MLHSQMMKVVDVMIRERLLHNISQLLWILFSLEPSWLVRNGYYFKAEIQRKVNKNYIKKT